jgi:hypothetical protein
VKVPDVAQIEAGGLAFFLRAIFALSLVYIVVSPFGDSMSQMSDDSTERYGHPDASGREEIYMRKLARAVNPNGVAPILMTLSAGFLAILRGQRASAELLLAELRASPAATAGAPKTVATVKATPREWLDQLAPQPKADPPPLPKATPMPAPPARPADRPAQARGTDVDDWDIPVVSKPKK